MHVFSEHIHIYSLLILLHIILNSRSANKEDFLQKLFEICVVFTLKVTKKAQRQPQFAFGYSQN